MTTTIYGDGTGTAPLMHVLRAGIIPTSEEDIDRARTERRQIRLLVPSDQGHRAVWVLPIDSYNIRTQGKDVFIEHIGPFLEDPDQVAAYSEERRFHMGYNDGLILNSLHFEPRRVGPADEKEFNTLKSKLEESGNW